MRFSRHLFSLFADHLPDALLYAACIVIGWILGRAVAIATFESFYRAVIP